MKQAATDAPGMAGAIGLFIGAIQLVMHIAGIRGARRLRELHVQGPTPRREASRL